MKQGDTVDIETAHKIYQSICTPYALDARPVIWPWQKAEDALVDWIMTSPAPERIKLTQRRLLHLICLEEEIKCLLSMPRRNATTVENYGIYIYDIYTPYDYTEGMMFGIGAHFVVIGANETESLKHKHNRDMIEAGEINAYRGIKEFKSAPEYEVRLFQMAHVLDHYAFDSCAVIKQRPTLKQAMNRTPVAPGAQPKEWPAIQVVALRKTDHKAPARHDPTGRKIGIRYPVVEHLRRQPTKAGVKLIKIAEHWRGPKDAPVKPKVEKIYKVTR